MYMYVQLFEFADKYRGKYDSSVREAKRYYPSWSGYEDELLWAALWLHRATGKGAYLEYVVENGHRFGGTGWEMAEFSWDVKHAGVQILATKVGWFTHSSLINIPSDLLLQIKRLILTLINDRLCPKDRVRHVLLTFPL